MPHSARSQPIGSRRQLIDAVRRLLNERVTVAAGGLLRLADPTATPRSTKPVRSTANVYTSIQYARIGKAQDAAGPGAALHLKRAI
jgi:hypothetical protein